SGSAKTHTLSLHDALPISVPGVIDEEDVKHMAEKPTVFAMANPTPEIMPEDAAPYVAVMATGRSDYPNQINNVLCFPGITATYRSEEHTSELQSGRDIVCR